MNVIFTKYFRQGMFISIRSMAYVELLKQKKTCLNLHIYIDH